MVYSLTLIPRNNLTILNLERTRIIVNLGFGYTTLANDPEIIIRGDEERRP